MRSSLLYTIIVFGLIGAVGAHAYASRNATAAATTSRALIASMVNPSNTLSSPRTYNQTLVESIDTAALTTTLHNTGLPVSGITFDVLPDSFHIQATATLTNTVNDSTNTTVAAAITTAVHDASAKLARSLFTDTTPEPVATVVLTRVLPLEAAIQQSPTAATLYGVIAGALFGWFIGLTLADQKRR